MSDERAPYREAALHELLETMQAASAAIPCAVCALTQRSVERSLKAFFAEYVNDLEVRLAFRKARGFCPTHTQTLTELGDALAVAILYRDLAEQTCLRWQAKERKGWRRWLGRKESQAPCPACLSERGAERRYVQALASALDGADVWAQLEQNRALCLPHLEQIVRVAPPNAAERLRDLEIERLNALQAELDEIIRKNDYRFQGEAWGEERDAWKRALYKLIRPASSR